MLAGLRSLFKKPEPAGPPDALRKFGSADRPIVEDAVSLEDGGWRIDMDPGRRAGEDAARLISVVSA